MPLTAVVFAGGDPPGAAAASHIPEGALVIAADSGLDHARALGIDVDLVIGDLDSVTAEAVEEARRADVEVREYPEDKDATDLELSIRAAVAKGAEHVVVIGGGGGRLDHLLGNLLVLSTPSLSFVDADLYAGTARVHLARNGRERTLPATVGELCSLLPLHGEVWGVTTAGLRWPLDREALDAGTSRGISNEATASDVTVLVEEGTLAVVFPGTMP